MSLKNSRKKIDAIDEKLIKNFVERMQVAIEIAEAKKASNQPILDESRERDILDKITEEVEPPLDTYARKFYREIFALNRAYQGQMIYGESPYVETLRKAVKEGKLKLNQRAKVACPGILGSNTQEACDKMIQMAQIMYVNNFSAVFDAVEQGLCEYGVLPLENSANGSVKEVYDLLEKKDCHIVRATKQWIGHNLCAKKGTKLENLTKIYSHPQALAQASKWLSQLKNVELCPMENTATAAKFVANSEDDTIACVCSANCAKLYHLENLAEKIQNSDNNYTRFICISKNLDVYHGANKISLITTANHFPGGLGAILSRFSSLGLNLTKLESRPIVGRDFEFIFYLDFEASLAEPSVRALLAELHDSQEGFTLLGNYIEY